jgi:predicted DNA binding CopG/RHH family protein
LPSPDELADIVAQTKITLALDNEALDFFKREARQRNTSYQRMIRNLVRSYARAHASAK